MKETRTACLILFPLSIFCWFGSMFTAAVFPYHPSRRCVSPASMWYVTVSHVACCLAPSVYTSHIRKQDRETKASTAAATAAASAKLSKMDLADKDENAGAVDHVRHDMIGAQDDTRKKSI